MSCFSLREVTILTLIKITSIFQKKPNIDSYFKIADKLGITVTEFGTDKIPAQQAKKLLTKIVEADTIHEGTVFVDILWDAYNSYDIIFDAIAKRCGRVVKNNKEKLTVLIKYLKLDTGLNRRIIHGKYLSEINNDASFHIELAAEAKELINK